MLNDYRNITYELRYDKYTCVSYIMVGCTMTINAIHKVRYQSVAVLKTDLKFNRKMSIVNRKCFQSSLITYIDITESLHNRSVYNHTHISPTSAHSYIKNPCTLHVSCECTHCVGLLAIVPPQGCESRSCNLSGPLEDRTLHAVFSKVNTNTTDQDISLNSSH